MRHGHLLLGLLSLGSLVASARADAPFSRQTVDSVDTVLTALEQKWDAAHRAADVATLDRLMIDSIVVVVPGMAPMTKANALGVLASGHIKFTRYEASEISIRAWDGIAIVNGRLQRTRVVDRHSLDDDWLFTKVYLKLAGSWQVVSFHASEWPAT